MHHKTHKTKWDTQFPTNFKGKCPERKIHEQYVIVQVVSATQSIVPNIVTDLWKFSSSANPALWKVIDSTGEMHAQSTNPIVFHDELGKSPLLKSGFVKTHLR